MRGCLGVGVWVSGCEGVSGMWGVSGMCGVSEGVWGLVCVRGCLGCGMCLGVSGVCVGCMRGCLGVCVCVCRGPHNSQSDPCWRTPCPALRSSCRGSEEPFTEAAQQPSTVLGKQMDLAIGKSGEGSLRGFSRAFISYVSSPQHTHHLRFRCRHRDRHRHHGVSSAPP